MTMFERFLSLFEWDGPLSRNLQLPRFPSKYEHPFSTPVLVAFFAIYFLGVGIIPPSRTRDSTLLAIYTALLAHLLTSTDIPVKFADTGIAIPIAVITAYLHWTQLFLYGCSPEDCRMYWYKDPKAPKPREMGLWEKVKWSLNYAVSSRGIGWNWEVQNIPAARQYRNRVHFCVDQIVRTVVCVLSSLLVQGFIAVITNGGTGPTTPLHIRIIAALVGLVLPIAGLLQTMHFLALVTVSLGLSDADNWRPVFGKWGDLISVRRLWAKVWHQNMRASGTRPADELLAKIGIPRKSAQGRAITRAIAFSLTAITHALGCYTYDRSDGGWIVYFALQWVMTEVEEGLSEVYDWCVGRRGKDRNRPREWWEKLFGFIWTMTWFAFVNLQVTEGGRKVGDVSSKSTTFAPLWENILGIKMDKIE
jgi:hypothetical protein